MLRRYVVIAQGNRHRVDVHENDGGRARVIVDGREYALDAARLIGVGSAAWSFLREGRPVIATVFGEPSKLGIQIREMTLEVSVVDADRHALERSRGAASESDGAQVLRASIPGRVVRCLVKQGDSVEVGQGLVIVEAMKMENELRAACRGRVREITIREGQSVESGEKLIVVEP